jgi:hypothetical protein
MSVTRPFAYNTGSTISGTEQVGDLAIGIDDIEYSASYGGVQWWMGPDEDLGYVITFPISGGTQPNPLNIPAFVSFKRSETKTEGSFVSFVNSLFNQTFTTGSECKIYLNNNGYWTSWIDVTPTPTMTPTPTVTPTLTPTPTPTITPSPSPVSGGIVQDNLFVKLDASNYTSGTWTDETGNGNNATINGATWQSTDGGIFDLDGTNDNISIPHNSSLSLSTTIQKTIQVWVKFDALGGLNQQIPVFGKLSSSFAFDGYWGGLFSNGGVIRCVTNGTGVQRISNSTSTVTTNTWYLMTFISQITSTSNTTKVYINETEYITAAHGNDGYSESNPLYLGWIGSGVSSLYLNGKIGACYFYTKGLSPVEVSTNFNATKTKYGL